MWIFSKKKDKSGVEIVSETTLERVSRLEKRLTRVEAENLDLMTAISILRDKVLRKIQFKNPKEEEETDPKDPYKGILIPDKG
jgi:hypothetical protein